MPFESKFSKAVYLSKYSLNQQETWAETVDRVVTAAGYSYIKPYMLAREFIPGGRYLYASGKPLHPIKNCFCFRALDSREGWAKLVSDVTMTLMLGGGIGVEYSDIRPKGTIIASTGGEASGVVSLMTMVDALAHQIVSGGSRRSALWAGVNWNHPEAKDFLTCKIRDPLLQQLKAKDFNFRMPLEMTNISIAYNDEFLLNPDRVLWNSHMRFACQYGDPGWSFNFGKNKNFTLRNAPVTGRTRVLTNQGYVTVSSIIDKEVVIWTGYRWAPTKFKLTRSNSDLVTVKLSNGNSITCSPDHPFIMEWEYDSPRSKTNISSVVLRVAAINLAKGDPIRSCIPLELSPNFTIPEYHVETVEEVVVENFKEDVYCCDVGVEEHCFMAEGVLISNCNEFISDTHMDSCNLGTIFINRIKDKDHMWRVTKNAVKFLLRGQLYSDLPTEEARKVTRDINSIGVGLGGVGEWLLMRNLPYEPNDELRELLEVWADTASTEGAKYAKHLGLNPPRFTRAIAPAGTISILAESTSGMEPLFCKAYIRKRWVGDKYIATYVVDECVKRLIAAGISPEQIYDSSDISFEKRIAFQAFLQDYTDMGISSTVNLPAWGTPDNNEGNIQEKCEILMRYMHRLRGVTVYPDGAINGQPLERCELDIALGGEGLEWEAREDTCRGGLCGI